MDVALYCVGGNVKNVTLKLRPTEMLLISAALYDFANNEIHDYDDRLRAEVMRQEFLNEIRNNKEELDA